MFDHFLDITIIIFFGFATHYPILLTIVPMRSIDPGFYRFNLGLSIIIGALAVFPIMILKIDYLYAKSLAVIWFLLLSSFTAFADLTNDQITGWVESALGEDKVTEIKANISNQIAELVTPTQETKTIGE